MGFLPQNSVQQNSVLPRIGSLKIDNFSRAHLVYRSVANKIEESGGKD